MLTPKHGLAFLSLVAILAASGVLTKVHAKQPQEKCYKLGDIVTIKGHAAGLINGGTYFEPLNPFCVFYPKPGTRFTVQNLTTIGSKLPPDVYVEVTGELSDPFPIYGVGIKVHSARDIDAEVKDAIAEANNSCSKWRQEHRAELSRKTNGGSVGTYDANNPDNTHQCCLMAANTVLPHTVVTICMPKQRKDAERAGNNARD